MEPESPFATKRQVVWLFLLFMAGVLLLAFLSQGAQDRQDVVIARQDAVIRIQDQTQSVLIRQTYLLCLARNTATNSHNKLVDELVTSVQQGSTLPSNEQSDRVARYKAAKIPRLVCPALP